MAADGETVPIGGSDKRRPMDFAVALAPGADTPADIELAEELGFDRAWVFDTPALQLDVWMTLALAGARTSTIGLGPGVLVPSLRHPMVTAAAIAHLVHLAPGRVEVGVGAGFTGRNAMGQRGLRWQEVEELVRTIQALLAGETVQIDGGLAAMLHRPEQAPSRPIEVDWRIGTAGPKGLATARRLGAAIFTSRPGSEVDYSPYRGVTAMVSGAILDPGEPLDSPRALATAGPGVAVVYHSSYERGDRSIEALHNGARFVELVEAIPPDRRHLAVHAGHLTELNAIDRQILDAKAMERSPLLCRAEDVPAAVERYAEMGVTQLAYQPMGDVPEAMARFAEAVGRGAAGRRTG